MAGGNRASSVLLFPFLLYDKLLRKDSNEYERTLIVNSYAVGKTYEIQDQGIYTVRRAKHHRRRFLSGKILYTTNGISTFKMERKLLICGDVSSNPGPKEVIPSITAQNAVRRLDEIRMLLSARTAMLNFMLNVLKYLRSVLDAELFMCRI